jgi:carboxylesterase
MTRHSHLDPSAFFLEGGPIGVLLIHGFTGSPPEMRRIGEYLHQRGLTVSAPLLPGHGTSVDDMNRSKWTEWTDCVERALAELWARSDTVFVGGLSLGSLLTLYLAAHHTDLPGVILYSPATWIADRRLYLTPVVKYLMPKRAKSPDTDLTDPEADRWFWCYEEDPTVAAHELLKLLRRVRRALPQVTCPILLIHSTLDRSIDANSARLTYERVSSEDKELVTLHNSGHCLTVDSEWESVAAKTHEFIHAHLPDRDR